MAGYKAIFEGQEKSGAECRIEPDPPRVLPEEDPIRIAAKWLKAEGKTWTLARRRAFFQSARRNALNGVISLLVVAGLIGWLGTAGSLGESGAGTRTTPFSGVIQSVPDILLHHEGKLPPYVEPPGRGRQVVQAFGKKTEIPATVTIPFSFRGVLPLDVGDSIEVDMWGSHPEANDAQFEAERVVWRGAVIEGKTSQVVSTSGERKGRIPGIVQSYRQEGNVVRFSVTVDRKIYEQDILPTLRQRG
jgi:hypothetical protein